jgi:hypothetical protein
MGVVKLQLVTSGGCTVTAEAVGHYWWREDFVGDSVLRPSADTRKSPSHMLYSAQNRP